MRDTATLTAIGKRQTASAGAYSKNGTMTENIAVVCPDGNEWSVNGFFVTFVSCSEIYGRLRGYIFFIIVTGIWLSAKAIALAIAVSRHSSRNSQMASITDVIENVAPPTCVIERK